MHDDLAEVARQLAALDSGRPRQAALRRAISTAYYALFHALCDACVATIIGWQRKPFSWKVISPIYRSVDHGGAKRVFSQLRSRVDTPEDFRRIAEAFLALQEARLRADYDPEIRFFRDDAVHYVDQAKDAIGRIQALTSNTRLELVVQLVSKNR